MSNHEKNILKTNRDFLFLYHAKQNNPNGDPDQENKPRMDYDTKTNLVTDVRLKRFIRDYIKAKYENEPDKFVFVSLEGDEKVSHETKLFNYLKTNIDDLPLELFDNDEEIRSKVKNLIEKVDKKGLAKNKEVNKKILAYLIKERFIDIRMFGSAFAVEGFTYAYTGPIQINWGYSLNEVYLMDSNSIVTIMSDEASTFGKDYRVWYSLLAFYGTINAKVAETTNLTEEDLDIFREAIWNGINFLPTRTKQNQYPLLYLEIEYNKDIANGLMGDLRRYIKVKPVDGKDFKQVRDIDDLVIDFQALYDVIKTNKDKIKAIYYRKSEIIDFDESKIEVNSKVDLDKNNTENGNN